MSGTVHRIPRPPFDPATLDLYHERIRRMVAAGMTDKEIGDEFLMVWHNGVQREQIEGYLRALRTVHSPIVEPVRAVGAMPTAEEVRRERDRRRVAREPSGYNALATHFHCSSTTIRRRLGALPPK